jgi:type I restriction enzyme M protein
MVKKDFSLTPSLYIDNEKVEYKNESFEETMSSLCSELFEQTENSKKLDARVKKSLNSLGFGF